jgi:hypothetical protein
MAITVDILLESVPPETEALVQKTCDDQKARIQRILRQESRLLKKQRDRDGSDNANENVNVAVEVKPGIPECLRGFHLPTADFLAILIAPYRLTIRQTRHGLDIIDALVARLKSSEEGEALLGDRDRHFAPIISLLDDLLHRSDGVDLVQMILGINADVLGAYIFDWPHDSTFHAEKASRIEIYWQVIGLFANEIKVSVEELTTVVLAHEQAHAYTHLGSDANGHSWQTQSFARSDPGLVEGLAQYYTEQIIEKLSKPHPGARTAYLRLLEKQPPDYHTHRHWLDHSTPEAVRIAMLEERRHPVGRLQSFNDALKVGNDRLRNSRGAYRGR